MIIPEHAIAHLQHLLNHNPLHPERVGKGMYVLGVEDNQKKPEPIKITKLIETTDQFDDAIEKSLIIEIYNEVNGWGKFFVRGDATYQFIRDRINKRHLRIVVKPQTIKIQICKNRQNGRIIVQSADANPSDIYWEVIETFEHELPQQ